PTCSCTPKRHRDLTSATTAPAYTGTPHDGLRTVMYQERASVGDVLAPAHRVLPPWHERDVGRVVARRARRAIEPHAERDATEVGQHIAVVKTFALATETYEAELEPLGHKAR